MNKIDLSNQKRTVFVEAYACSDYGDGPQYAKLIVDQAFCEKLLRLQKLCVENCLTELRICDSPDRWGPGEIENECRFTGPELVITPSSFWFVDQPKHASYHVETRAQDISAFVNVVATSCEPLFLGDDPGALDDLLLDLLEQEEVESA